MWTESPLKQQYYLNFVKCLAIFHVQLWKESQNTFLRHLDMRT